MKTIVIDAREWSTSTGRYMRSLAPRLEQLATEDNYVILMQPADLTSWETTKSNFRKLACPYAAFSFGEQLGFKQQLDKLKPDLVHFGMTHQPIRYRGPIVTTIHDLTTTRFTNPSKNPLVFKIKQQIYKYVVKRVARKSAAIITPSQFVKDDVVAFSGISPDKITVIHEAANKIAAAAEPLENLGGKDFIMYVGRPMLHKNLERLVECFELIKAQHPNLHLVLAGKKDANYQRIEKLVQQRGLNDVHFTDHVSEGQLRWLYENTQAYIFPSLSEGFGLPGLEAMAHGAPVISSNATALSEIYGQAARYFDPTDIQSMTEAISEVLANNQLRRELIQSGQAQVAKYSWQVAAVQTLSVYKKVLGHTK